MKNYSLKKPRLIVRFSLSSALLFLLAVPNEVSSQQLNLNSRPTLEKIADVVDRATGDTRFISLSGITAGMEPNQLTQVSISCVNDKLFEALEVNPTSNGSGFIQYRAKKGAEGTAIITVTVIDNGEPFSSVSRSFALTIEPAPKNAPEKPEVVETLNLFAEGKDLALKAHPNPTASSTLLSFSTRNNEAQVSVDIYNIAGVKLMTVYRGQTVAGQLYTRPFNPSRYQSEAYIVKLTTSRQSEIQQVIVAR